MRIVRRNFATALLVSLYVYSPIVCAMESTPSETVIIKSSEDYANTPWAKLKIPAGTKLITRKTESGKELRSLKFVGGVSISELEDGGILSMDNSKGGAVMCAWEIYATMKNTMDKCHPEETELRQNFDLAIEKLEKFIVANNQTPITKTEIETDRQKKRDMLPDQCKGETDEMTKYFLANKSEFLEKFQESIDASLAIPRPPVLNPCL